MMTADPIDLDAEDMEVCDECGCLTESTDGGMCPVCAAAAEAKDEARDQAEAEIDEATDELDALKDQLAELQAQIRAARGKLAFGGSGSRAWTEPRTDGA